MYEKINEREFTGDILGNLQDPMEMIRNLKPKSVRIMYTDTNRTCTDAHSKNVINLFNFLSHTCKLLIVVIELVITWISDKA